MPTGTLCISKVTAQPESYRATFVAYDATPPSTFTMHGADQLRSFLESVGLGESDRDRAVREAKALSLALLMNVEVTSPARKTRAA
jgi:hypothetical protein